MERQVCLPLFIEEWHYPLPIVTCQYAATAVGNVRQELKEVTQQLRLTQVGSAWCGLAA